MAIEDKKTVIRAGLNIMIVLLAMVLAACTSTAPATAEAPAVVAEAEIVDDFEGDGMEIPLDGSSLEAFDASLAMVKRHADEASYTTLEKAIDYLLLYDLGAKRDKAKLAARLDGLNGYEVVAKVGWRKPAPGKGNAEKGAADVKIIDT
jgi:hypothetical protein